MIGAFFRPFDDKCITLFLWHLSRLSVVDFTWRHGISTSFIQSDEFAEGSSEFRNALLEIYSLDAFHEG